jgi:plastocyanin
MNRSFGACRRFPGARSNGFLRSLALLGALYCVPGISSAAAGGIVVKFEATGFSAMNVQLVKGGSLRFANPTAHALSLQIVTWRGKAVKSYAVPAHGAVSWKPAAYGVYDYYDAGNSGFGNVAIQGAGGEKVYQVVAHQHSGDFPAPVYGVVAVTNEEGGGIPLSTSYGPMEVSGKSTLLGQHRRKFMSSASPWMEVPAGTMTFKPWVLVVKAGQAVQVYNEDGMKHGFFPGAYPVLYDDHGKISTYRRSFKGFVLHKNGGHRSIVFSRPGIYHVLCPIHSYAWKHSYKSRRTYGGYPYVMDAVVVVEPARKA